MQNKEVIAIKNHAAISALGSSASGYGLAGDPDIYCSSLSGIKICEIEGATEFAARLNDKCNQILDKIATDPRYSKLDRSVLLAICAGRLATQNLFLDRNKRFLVNIGSSRGATGLFERFYKQFLKEGKTAVLTSPTTTLGNISSWLAQDIDCEAECLSTSVTCSTGLQAIGNSIAWLRSGLADFAIAGAAEAPLTAFTVAQMQALRIYADNHALNYPCQPCAAAPEKGSGMVLGEGAAIFVLERTSLNDARVKDQLVIESYGYGREQIGHSTAISDDGECLYRSMYMALEGLSVSERSKIDLVILHAPGTSRGDSSEIAAVKRIFQTGEMPILLSNKWQFGHTFGAAGTLSLDYACNILRQQKFADFPYSSIFNNSRSGSKINRIMINAAGFGGNAASIIVSLPSTT